MWMEIAIVGAVGGAILVADQQNLVPQISNNPQKRWIWDPQRYQPVVATPIRRPISSEQALIEKVKREEAEALALAQRQSKYSVVGQQLPIQPFNQRPLGFYKSL